MWRRFNACGWLALTPGSTRKIMSHRISICEGRVNSSFAFFSSKGEIFELKWGDLPNAKVLKLLGRQVRSKRAELLIEWSKKVQVKP
jgi:hypothetical protein